MRKVIHLELKSVEENQHFYFGSIASMYDMFPVEQIGIAAKSLYSYDLIIKPYENKKVIIRTGELNSKKGERGIKSTKTK